MSGSLAFLEPETVSPVRHSDSISSSNFWDNVVFKESEVDFNTKAME